MIDSSPFLKVALMLSLIYVSIYLYCWVLRKSPMLEIDFIWCGRGFGKALPSDRSIFNDFHKQTNEGLFTTPLFLSHHELDFNASLFSLYGHLIRSSS